MACETTVDAIVLYFTISKPGLTIHELLSLEIHHSTSRNSHVKLSRSNNAYQIAVSQIIPE